MSRNPGRRRGCRGGGRRSPVMLIRKRSSGAGSGFMTITRRFTYGKAGMGAPCGQARTMAIWLVTSFSICGYRVRPE